jgi:ElaB/YqjD/DUF883 family membrane-anchored ribosome-binding protein
VADEGEGIQVELDRQSIEKRDFPITRRGYDPVVVNAHLAALADKIEHGDRTGGHDSVATIASGMVQTILDAAESTAADIERSAKDEAAQLRHDAEHAAQNMRDGAVAKSRSHVTAVASATEPMLERVAMMERDVGMLVADFRTGVQQLTSELALLAENMNSLYGAASTAGDGARRSQRAPAAQPPPAPVEPLLNGPVDTAAATAPTNGRTRAPAK